MLNSGLDLLLDAHGQALLDELAELAPEPVDELRLAGRLRTRYPAELVSAALGLHALRLRARAKFSRAMSMYLTRDGLEQASGEPAARHRARRYAGAVRIADLCSGIGGDLIGLAAAGAEQVLAVDLDPVHLRMATVNARVYDVAATVRTECVDVREADLTGVDAVFVDPARRAAGRRLRTGDSEPPLSWCADLAARVPRIGVKAAPGLDRAGVPPGWEVEFVAAGRELKEAVLWSPAMAGDAGPVPTRATLLMGDGRGDDGAREFLAVPGGPVDCRAPGEYLLDPSPAITRAGLVEDLARSLDGAWKIDPMIAFLSADRPLTSPFGRSLKVLDSGPWRQKELAGRLKRLGIGSVDIRRRGLAGDTDALRRSLKLPPGRPATLVMTRVDDRPWALVCVDV